MLAVLLLSASDQKAACALLEKLIAKTPHGPERAWLGAMLATWELDDFARRGASLKELLPEARGDAGVSARIAILIAGNETEAGGIASALRYGRSALVDARASDDAAVHAYVLTTLAHIEAYAGLPAREHLDLADGLAGELPSPNPYRRPRFIMSLVARQAGRLEEARALLEPICEQLRDDAEVYNLSHALPYMVDLEWRAGNWQRAADLAEEGCALSIETQTMPWQWLFARAGRGGSRRDGGGAGACR
ncbi:MAG: hypothetical protein ABSC51_10375 [Gaiellaceae bacterium]